MIICPLLLLYNINFKFVDSRLATLHENPYIRIQLFYLVELQLNIGYSVRILIFRFHWAGFCEFIYMQFIHVMYSKITMFGAFWYQGTLIKFFKNLIRVP